MAISETDLLNLLDVIRARLPARWKLEREQIEPHLGRGMRPDATAVLTDPQGMSAAIIIEVKSQPVEAHKVPYIAAQLRRYDQCVPLLLCPFLGKAARTRLLEYEVNYIDSVGNSRLAIEKPAIFIETTGTDKNPYREAGKPLRSLKGAGAGRAIRALCDFIPPYGVRELAKCSDAAVSAISRVADLLERDGLVQRSSGRIIDVDWCGVLRRWSQDYVLFVSGKYTSYLEPRGLSNLLSKLQNLQEKWALTGSLALNQRVSVSPARLGLVYVPNVRTTAKNLQLVETETGANVILLEPFDPVVFSRLWDWEMPQRNAAATQVAVDLMVSPGRGPAEAEALLEWMGKNVSVWRRKCI
ncbi:hypothetical protein [Gloeobacter kilaueensis]|uniref:Uncharacterized protein n=1 Tax=Gloeobacter kilaueensis (strain ATCC BAA-2537 / CCAP 1431/1 / ULC 316 / JS1) TaxID=1183438 RepID=U5QNZ1_GLOK1|nr:hypothetical protein [Gloeobacter kilaueensis]AGY59355.1 hypothetical protein GKIL_3109 [Gloeobacter kilaueensis JS1]